MKCIRGESSQDSASSTLRKIEERICNPRTKHIHPVVAGTGAHGQFPRSPASMILLFYFQPCSWSRRARFSTPSTSPRKQRGKVFLGRWKRNGRGRGGSGGREKGGVGEDRWTKKVAYGVLHPLKVSYSSRGWVSTPVLLNSDPFILSHGR